MNTRYAHRKRPSALRLSTDSTSTPLPLYTSTTPVILHDLSDRPPDYPDSAEEADEDPDSDTDESLVNYSQFTASPRRRNRLRSPPSNSKRIRAPSADPYLDALLARSVHALEMSNALLQSSVNTHSSLGNVSASDEVSLDTSLETHARNLSSRIASSTARIDDLNVISRGVESLLLDDELSQADTASRSLPASSSMSSLRRSHLRRPSLDFRNAPLQLSNHDRNDLIAPPPRAITMYVDSTDDPASISLPRTLGIRSSTRLPVTPMPPESHPRPLLLHTQSESDTPKRALDILSSYIATPANCQTNSSSPSSSSSLLTARRPRSGSASTSRTGTTARQSVRSGPSRSRSPSHSPCRSYRHERGQRDWDTPPIIELPSSSSESSEDLHNVERSVSYLRNILQSIPAKDKGKEKEKEQEKLRPSILSPPSVAPVADTSTATASVSRLFTKARHTHSTRPPSPPRHSALKGSASSIRREQLSVPSTPVSPVPSLSGSWLSVSDALSFRASGSSGRSTPNRVSFAELPPDTGQNKSKSSSSLSRSRSRSRSKGKGRKRKGGESESDGDGPWWTWILGVGGGGGTSTSPGAPTYVRNEERLARGTAWTARPSGFGSGIEEWGV